MCHVHTTKILRLHCMLDSLFLHNRCMWHGASGMNVRLRRKSKISRQPIHLLFIIFAAPQWSETGHYAWWQSVFHDVNSQGAILCPNQKASLWAFKFLVYDIQVYDYSSDSSRSSVVPTCRVATHSTPYWAGCFSLPSLGELKPSAGFQICTVVSADPMRKRKEIASSI